MKQARILSGSCLPSPPKTFRRGQFSDSNWASLLQNISDSIARAELRCVTKIHVDIKIPVTGNTIRVRDLIDLIALLKDSVPALDPPLNWKLEEVDTDQFEIEVVFV